MNVTVTKHNFVPYEGTIITNLLFSDDFNDGDADGWQNYGAEVMTVIDKRLYIEDRYCDGYALAEEVDLPEGFEYQAEMEIDKYPSGDYPHYGIVFNVAEREPNEITGYYFGLNPDYNKAELWWFYYAWSSGKSGGIEYVRNKQPGFETCSSKGESGGMQRWASKSVTVNTGTNYTLKVVKNGLIATCYLNGEEMFTVNIDEQTLPNFPDVTNWKYTDGTIGLMANGGAYYASAYFDNVLVQFSGENGCVGHESGYVYNCGDCVNESCTLNGDLTCPSGYGLVVGASGITINGNGYCIDGVNNGRTGIDNSDGHDNVTIRNLEVKRFCDGILLKGCANNTIDNCEVHHNDNDGILLEYCENNTIDNCEVHHNGNESVDSSTNGIELEHAWNKQ